MTISPMPASSGLSVLACRSARTSHNSHSPSGAVQVEAAVADMRHQVDAAALEPAVVHAVGPRGDQIGGHGDRRPIGRPRGAGAAAAAA